MTTEGVGGWILPRPRGLLARERLTLVSRFWLNIINIHFLHPGTDFACSIAARSEAGCPSSAASTPSCLRLAQRSCLRATWSFLFGGFAKRSRHCADLNPQVCALASGRRARVVGGVKLLRIAFSAVGQLTQHNAPLWKRGPVEIGASALLPPPGATEVVSTFSDRHHSFVKPGPCFCLKPRF